MANLSPDMGRVHKIVLKYDYDYHDDLVQVRVHFLIVLKYECELMQMYSSTNTVIYKTKRLFWKLVL